MLGKFIGKFKMHLTFLQRQCIIINEMRLFPNGTQNDPLRNSHFLRGSDHYFERWLTFRRVTALFFSSVQPFAYVVCNHTCHYGQNKREDFQMDTPPFRGKQPKSLYHSLHNLSTFAVCAKEHNYM